MTTVAKLGIAITADDKTAKGVNSAEKRLGGVGKGAAKAIGGADRAGSRMGGMRNLVRTFGDVDDAASRAFGNRSVFATIGARASQFRAIGSAIGSGLGRTSAALGDVETAGAGAAAKLGGAAAGLGEAAAAGEAAAGGIGEAAVAVGGLGAALGPVGIALAATVAVVGAAAYAGYKFASSWAFGAAELGRLSDRLGIATQDLQKFQQAGERVGVGKDATNGAISGFANIAHDAYYARNPEARVLLRKLGVGFTKKADGTLDYNAMLADLSRGLQAQSDPMTQSMVADRLGVGAMLPLLRNGAGNLKGELGKAGAYGAINSDGDTATARKFVYDSAALAQLGKRQINKAQAGAAALTVPILGGAVNAGQSLTDAFENPAKRQAMIAAGAAQARAIGTKVVEAISPVARILAPAAAKLDRAGDKMITAADRLIGVVPGQTRLNSGFGARDRPRKPDGTYGSAFHQGVDFRYADGTKVGAVADGIVKAVGQHHGYGNTVEIDHGNGETSFYAHLSRAMVRVGQHVSAGEAIALSGHSGGVAPHLHFEERRNGHAVDPLRQGGLLRIEISGAPPGSTIKAHTSDGRVAVSRAH
jgi:murein DD-endopeptidase MepM/ murein hydrolase activator NlpD